MNQSHPEQPAALTNRSSGRVESPLPSRLTTTKATVTSGADRVTQRTSIAAVPRLGRRGLTRLADGLSQRDHALLHDVARFRLLTGLQLQSLHFGFNPAAARAARRCLKRLHDARLLTRLKRRVGGVRAGSDGFVYALGPAGDRLLDRDRPRRRVREVSDGFLTHTLAVAEVYVQLQNAARSGGLAVRHLETEPVCWRRLDSGGDDWLKPDLLSVITTAGNEFHSFVELDQGSEHAPALLRKLRTYELAYRLGVVAVEQEVFPRVVWLVPDDGRAVQLQRLISDSGALTAELHLVARHEQAVAALSGGSHEESRGGNPPTGATP